MWYKYSCSSKTVTRQDNFWGCRRPGSCVRRLGQKAREGHQFLSDIMIPNTMPVMTSATNTRTTVASAQRWAHLRSAVRRKRTRSALSSGEYHAVSSVGEWKLMRRRAPSGQKSGKTARRVKLESSASARRESGRTETPLEEGLGNGVRLR